MPASTETRIQEVCKRILGAKTMNEVEPLISELREALREHIQLARISLEAQAETISALQTLSKRTPFDGGA
jgi:hypothetical protein